jgi:hypothetical protein
METFVCPYCGRAKQMSAGRLALNRTCGAPACKERYRREIGHGNRGRQTDPEVNQRRSDALRGRRQEPGHIAAKTAARAERGWFKPGTGNRISAGRRAGKAVDVTGPKNGMWRGGVTALRSDGRGTREYAVWRDAVLGRSAGRCERCGSDRHVVAHHLQGWRERPDLRVDAGNGIALCRKCHAAEHGFAQQRRDDQEDC